MDLIILGSEAHALRLQNALPARTPCTRVATFAEAFRRIVAARPPAGLVVVVDALDEACTRGIASLAARGLLVPTAIYFPRADPGQFDRAWQLASLGVDRLFENAELCQRLELLTGSTRALSRYLLAHVSREGEVVRGFLELLASRRDAAFLEPPEVAAALSCARSSLYAALERERFPPARSVQLLFKLLPAQRILARGGSVADSACVAGYAAPRCLREALKCGLDWSVDELRTSDWRAMADRWFTISAPDVKRRWTGAPPDWTEGYRGPADVE